MKKKILIVDDEWSVLEFLRSKFIEFGYEIQTAKNGKEFCLTAAEHNPDLIILDLMLPDGLGTEHYDRLLENGFKENVPVIFISSLAQDQTPRHALPKGRYALFGKPFDCQELLNEAKKLLEVS